MFRSLRVFALPFIVLALCAIFSMAQTDVTSGGYNWTTPVAGTGQLGQYLVQLNGAGIPPRAFTISWSVAGTAPSVCTYRVEGSNDAVNWFGLDATAPSVDAVPCTSSNMISIVDRPVRVVRVHIVSYTAGDSTTAVTFQYTKGL